MSKNSSWILLSFLLWSCSLKQQIIIPWDLQKWNPGRCYISNVQPEAEDLKFERFTLEIIKPTFKDETVVYYLDQMLEENPYFKSLQFRTRSHSLKYIILEKEFSGFTKYPFPKSYAICLVEEAGRYKTVKKSDFVNNKLEIKTKVVKDGPMVIKTFVKNKPENLLENQYYFEGYNWSDLKEIVYADDE